MLTLNLFRSMAVAVGMVMAVAAYAIEIDYVPTTAWPYVYQEFREGKVTTSLGEELKHDKLNISLADGKAHFVQNDVLMELDLRVVATVYVGEDEYVPVSGRLVKVVGRTEHGITALSVTINVAAMNSSEVGYGGTSLLTSTQKVSANAIASGSDYSSYRSISEIAQDEGEPLKLKTVRGIVHNRTFIPASRYDILNIVGIDKEAVKKYMKDNKIRLSEDEDLARLAEYIGTL